MALRLFNLEDTRLVCRAIGGCVNEGVGLEKCPEEIEGDEAILEHGVETVQLSAPVKEIEAATIPLLDVSVVLVEVLQQDLQMHPLVVDVLLLLLTRLLLGAFGLLLFELFAVGTEILKIPVVAC